jgi:phage-related protein
MATDNDIGDVSVDVVADTTSFEARLKAKLDEMSKKLQAKIAIALQTAAANVDLSAWVKKASAKALDIRTKVDTALASAGLDVWIKEQSLKAISLGVNIRDEALAKAAIKLKALTGITALSGGFEHFGELLTGFFSNLPKIAQMTAAFGSLGAVALDTLGGLGSTLLTVLPAVSGFGAALLAYPGLLASVATSVAIVTFAIKGAPPAIKAAVTQYKVLQNVISNNFWAKAQKPVESFFNGMLPIAKKGLGAVSAELGSFLGGFIADFQDSLGGSGALAKIFSNMVAGLKQLAPAAKPFAQILANLGVYGTSLLPQIAYWISQVAATFNTWLTNAIATGALNKDLQNLGAILQLVWNAAKSLVQVLTGIGTAAQAAGIQNMLTPLAMLGKIVNSPAFQTALTTFFKGASVGAQGLMSALTPIGNMLASLAPILSGFLAGAGQTIGSLFSGLAKALSAPVFKTGLSAFFAGVLNFIQPIIPLLPVFAEKLGIIGTLAGTVLTALGPVFATALRTLVPVLGQLLVAIAPVAAAVGPLLSSALNTVIPLVLNLSKVLVPVGTAVGAVLSFITPLLPILVALAAPILAIVGAFKLWNLALEAYEVISKIATAAQIAFDIAMDANPIGIIITAIAALVAGLIYFFTQTKLGKAVWQNIVNFLTTAWNGMLAVGKAVFGAIGSFFVSVWNGIETVFKNVLNFIVNLFLNWTLLGIIISHFGQIRDFITSVFTNISNFISGVLTGIANFLAPILAPFLAVWNGFWTGIFRVFQAIWVLMESIAIIEFTVIKNVITAVLTFISSLWNTVWGAISSFFVGIWNQMVAFYTPIILGIQTFIGTVVGLIASAWNAAWSGISSFFAGIWNGLVAFYTPIIHTMQAVIAAVIGAIASGWKSVWGGVSSFFSSLWSGFVAIVSGPINKIKSVISTATGLISTAWSKTWNGLKSVVQNIWGGIQSFIKGGINGIIDLINGFISGVNKVASAAGAITGGAVKLHVAPLPHLAQGGTVLPRPGGTLAVLGEGGKAESVVDTGLMNKMLQTVLSAFPAAVSALKRAANTGVASSSGNGDGGPGTQIDNHFESPGADPKAVAQEFVNRLAEKVGLG